ncbi:MAG: hypothetical protein ACRD1V_11105 [Vicinamibacterales bacterium]
MHRLAYAFVIVLVSLLAPACGSTSGPAQSGSGGSRQPAATTSASGSAGNPCDRKLVGKDDVAGIVTSPITTVEPLQGDPQTCEFKTAGFNGVRVTVRPGLGDGSVHAWETGGMNLSVTPLAGVGDRAVWQDMLREVIATKHNVLCDVSVTGGPGGAAKDAQKRLGDLCNTIFSRQ